MNILSAVCKFKEIQSAIFQIQAEGVSKDKKCQINFIIIIYATDSQITKFG
jgi:hypothetical protein